MFTAVVTVWIASAGLSLTIQNQPVHSYATDYECKLRVAEIVHQIGELQAQMPSVQMTVASAGCVVRR
jgi:hypothetical protein